MADCTKPGSKFGFAWQSAHSSLGTQRRALGGKNQCGGIRVTIHTLLAGLEERCDDS